jgi:hypothetical protein
VARPASMQRGTFGRPVVSDDDWTSVVAQRGGRQCANRVFVSEFGVCDDLQDRVLTVQKQLVEHRPAEAMTLAGGREW